tara:strand:+ start:15791 stop:16324 length:534 start_codon:yes stop_codon:yes gene_type:complete
MFYNKPTRDKAEINGSSMADIAFLLLIFFLVTTTINVDTGIGLVLPPPPTDEVPFIHERNLMNILVNSKGEILMDDRIVEIHEVKKILIEFINNWGHNPELSDSPERAIISLKTQRETPYKVYIDMLDEVMETYNELRNKASLDNFGIEYAKLIQNSPQQALVKELFPKKISISDEN